MFENKEITTKIIDKTDLKLNNLTCYSCNSQNIIRNGSYIRDIQDLGSLREKILVRFESITLKCKDCGAIFHHEIEEALLNYRYTKNVIELSMSLMLEQDLSAQKTSDQLKKYYQVDVSKRTLSEWLNTFGLEFLQKKNLVPDQIFENYTGYISIDGKFPKIQVSEDDKSPIKRQGKKKHSY